MLVTLKNDFHGTSTRVRAGKLSPETIARVQKALCGMGDCSCSGNLGTRGPQECNIDEDLWGNITVSPKE